MLRVKLQSETVADPNAYMVKVNVPDTTEPTTTPVPTDNTANKSNVSGNEVAENPNTVVESFYNGLGTNLLDAYIHYDHLTHNYAIVDLGVNNRIDNCQTQIKEMFEANNIPTVDSTVDPTVNTTVDPIISNNLPNNPATNQTKTDNTPTMPIDPLSADFISNNPVPFLI